MAKECLPLNLSSCNSETSEYSSRMIHGPVHSTPRGSEQNSHANQSLKSREDVDVYLQKTLSERDKELKTVLKAYETTLIGWDRDKHSLDGRSGLDKHGRCKVQGDSVLKRCSSIASQSSHDSGHQTDSASNTSSKSSLPPEIFPVIELVQALAQQVCATQEQLDTTKEENLNLKRQVEDLKKYTRQNLPEKHKSDAVKDEQIDILANQTAALMLQFSNVREELHLCRKSHKLANEELESLRTLNISYNEEIICLKKEKEELKSKLKQLSRLEEADVGSAVLVPAQDRHRQIVPALNEASHERMHLELNTMKMLVDRQQEVIQVLQKCLYDHDNKPTRDSDVQHPSRDPLPYVGTQRRLSELSIECGPLTDDSNFTSSASTLTNISELSCFTWTSRSSRASTSDADRSASSRRSSTRSRLKGSDPLKLKTGLQTTENDKSILKLNQLLLDSKQMLCAMNKSSQS